MASRTFGWIQDSGSFTNMKRILKAMDIEGEYNKYLREVMIPQYVPLRFGRNELINELLKCEMDYGLLKGKGDSQQLTVAENMEMFGYTEEEAKVIVNKGGRGNAACTGIVQICLDAQKKLPDGNHKPYQGDWQADCFIRLGVSVGFLDYNPKKDTCRLSGLGKEFISTKDDSDEEKDIIGRALLCYPPACRVMELLDRYGHMTKFEIGSQLGFRGEAGFTSIPQNIFVSGYQMESSGKEKTKIRQNAEGSADKYARMIAAWLVNIGWAVQTPKQVKEVFAGVTYTMKIGQSYMLSLRGRQNLNKISGGSNCLGSHKIVFRDMLATKADDREYLRNRRALMIDFLKNERSVEAIQNYLASNEINEDAVTIEDDLKNFENIGLHIRRNDGKYRILDTIIGLEIPKKTIKSKSDVLIVKDRIRNALHNIDHKYLILLDLAYDSNANKEFEIETMSLLTNELKYKGAHLGGSSKPDGVFYKDKNGVIVDTKSYSNGYSLPLSQADEMIRYIEENKKRGNINPNEWWKSFGTEPISFSYLFVSSKFTGGFQNRIDYINRRTGYDGGVISAENLLLFAEKVIAQQIGYSDSFSVLRTNSEIKIDIETDSES